MKFEDLTINQYLKIVEIEKSDLSTVEKKIKKLELIKGNSDNLPINSLNEVEFDIPIDLKFKKSIYIGFKKYNVVNDLTQLGVNQLVDFYALTKAEAPINEILPILYNPYNPDQHKELSKAFLSKKVGDVLGTVFFFKRLFHKCEKPITEYLEKHLLALKTFQTEIQTDKEFQAFLNIGGGNTTLTYAQKTSV